MSKRKFSKSKKNSKFQKSPKSFQKLSQRVLNKFRGDFFEIIFCPVFHGGSSLRKFSKKSKKFQISKNAQNRPQKCPNENFQNQKKIQNSKHAQNRSQKCPNVFWSCFRVIFSRKFFAQCSMEGRVFESFQKNQKNFKIPKMSKIVPKRVQTCFEDVLGWFIRKKLFAQCSMGGRVFESFQKNQKIFKIPKMPKFDPKSVQTCFEDVLGWFFRKNFLPSVPWRVESSKIFKKIRKVSKFQNAQNRPQKCPNENFQNQKKFQNSKNAQNRSQKCPNVFWRCFRVIFLKDFFAQCSMEGRVFEFFQKKSKKFQKSKNAQKRPQKCPNENFQNQKNFKITKKPKIVPKSVPTCFEQV